MDAMEQAYAAWRQTPTPVTMAQVIQASMPTLKSASTSYARGQQLQVLGQAKRLAIEAIQKYDPKSGAKLSTYLMHQLQPLYRIAHQRRSAIQIPETAYKEMQDLNSAREDLRVELGRDPDDTELADKTGISTRRIRGVGKYHPESYEGSTVDEGGMPISNQVVTRNPEEIWMEFLHHDLSPVDRKILEWKTGYNDKPILQSTEIAKKLNLTPAAVSQHATKIHARLIDTPESQTWS